MTTSDPALDLEGSRLLAPAWVGVALLTAVLTAVTTMQSLARYEALDSGWSWDLAYYNQWFWCVTHDIPRISVRPAASYATEGPSVWKMNYLAPIRLLIAPFYALAPGPPTLIVLQNVVFWWVIPAAFGLVRSESGSTRLALLATALVPLTPFFWPLCWNDFRELQLVIPFVLWAVQGVRERSIGLTALGVAGMLACRQEFAVMIATFAFLPPRRTESLTRALRWRNTLVMVGGCWFLFAFFGYLHVMVSPGAPDQFIDQFLGPKAAVGETLWTSGEMLLLGMGAWAILALFAPRVFILAIPWIWGLCSGRWANRFLSTTDWHHVRYVVPATAVVLAAGLIGFANLGRWLAGRRGWLAVLVFTGSAVGVSAMGLHDVNRRLSSRPRAIDAGEAAVVWSWVREVGPGDGVVADYELSAPLSSRATLYSYILDSNLPPGFPNLEKSIRWLFLRNDSRFYKLFLSKDFQIVHQGRNVTIARRVD